MLQHERPLSVVSGPPNWHHRMWAASKACWCRRDTVPFQPVLASASEASRKAVKTHWRGRGKNSKSDSKDFFANLTDLAHNSGSANAHDHVDELWRQRPRRIVRITGIAHTTHASPQARMRMPVNSIPYAAAPLWFDTLACPEGAGGCRLVGPARSLISRTAGWPAFGPTRVVVYRRTENAGLGSAKTGQSGAILFRRQHPPATSEQDGAKRGQFRAMSPKAAPAGMRINRLQLFSRETHLPGGSAPGAHPSALVCIRPVNPSSPVCAEETYLL